MKYNWVTVIKINQSSLFFSSRWLSSQVDFSRLSYVKFESYSIFRLSWVWVSCQCFSGKWSSLEMNVTVKWNFPLRWRRHWLSYFSASPAAERFLKTSNGRSFFFDHFLISPSPGIKKINPHPKLSHWLCVYIARLRPLFDLPTQDLIDDPLRLHVLTSVLLTSTIFQIMHRIMMFNCSGAA